MANVRSVPLDGGGRADSPTHAPVSLLSQSLITFVNKHLNKLNLEVTELETQVSAVLGLSGPGRAALSCPSGKEWPPCSLNSEARPLWPTLRPSVLISCGCWNQGPQTFPSSQSWRLVSQTCVGRAASFRGCEGVSVPGLSPSSGGLLAVLGFCWVGDASLGSLPSWSRGAPPVCASVSTFPLLVRTLVVLDEGPSW